MSATMYAAEPTVQYAAPPAQTIQYAAAPTAMTYAAAPVQSYAAGAPMTYSVSEYMQMQAGNQPATTYAAAPQVTYAQAPQVTYAAPTPAVTYAAQAPAVATYQAEPTTAYAAPVATQTYAAPQQYAGFQAQPQYISQQPQVMMQQPQVMMQQPQVMMQQPQMVMQQPQQPQMYMQQPQMYTQQPQPQMYMQQPQMVMQQQPHMVMQQPGMFAQPGMQQVMPPPGAPVESSKDAHVQDGPVVPKTGNVHALITGIDYACDSQSWAGPPPHGHGPLDTKYAFDMMVDLCKQSEVASLTTLWNQQCTIQGMVDNIIQVGQKCGPGDTFVFYYTGHGDQLPNPDAATEGEAMDQCFCTVDANGNTDDPTMRLRAQVWMRDDVFARAILDATRGGGTALVLCDCCHSGTICDFTPQSEWARRQQPAISISGCQDSQTSAGTGKGGHFTRSLTMAIQDQNGKQGYNVATVFNRTLDEYQAHKTAGHTQTISVHGCKVYPDKMAWPLQPKGQYMSPANTTYRGLVVPAASTTGATAIAAVPTSGKKTSSKKTSQKKVSSKKKAKGCC